MRRPEQRKHEGECDDADNEGDAHDGAGEGEGVEDVPEAAELCQHHQLEAVHLDVAGLDLWERTWSLHLSSARSKCFSVVLPKTTFSIGSWTSTAKSLN